ncbi:hypothetical protein [Amycolatopsis sp. 195334CR]|uniref:hypothetical protein n=1 Tax=Amycolatopsis sp. 195334CR TaxID=2814588 RepID=UPI001A8DF28E|nr:hypothetical protein [Amycolatopsis sp. 195334CR]MBN6037738.1 hypothetical protein [Amycolatopsis sp. 195334CR]
MSLSSHNRRAMQKFANNIKKDLEKEFKRKPIKVPLEAMPIKSRPAANPDTESGHHMESTDFPFAPTPLATISIQLMEWIAQQPEPTQGFHSFNQFAREANIDRSKASEAGRLLEAHGLATVIEDGDGVDGHLTPPGQMQIQQIMSIRSDKSRRISILTGRMLNWLNNREDESPPIDFTEFLQDSSSYYLGRQFDLQEVRKSAQYLHDKGYVNSIRIDQEVDGFIRPTLTARGLDVVMSSDTPAVHASTRVETTVINNGPVIHGDANGSMQIAVGDHNSMLQLSRQEVTPGHEALATLITQILREIKGFNLVGDDEEIIRESGQEVLEETTSQQPQKSRIRKSIAAVKGVLSGVAHGAATGANEGAQELAKNMLTELQNVVL